MSRTSMTGAVDPFILAVKEVKRFIYLPFVILFVLCTARDLCVAYESAFHIERGKHNFSAVGLLEKCSCFFTKTSSVRILEAQHFCNYCSPCLLLFRCPGVLAGFTGVPNTDGQTDRPRNVYHV